MGRRRWIRVLAVVACVSGAAGACSSFEGTDADPVVPPRIDASSGDALPEAAVDLDAAATTDAAAADAAGPCDRTKPFAKVRKVDGVNTPSAESHARLSPDERVIYFQRAPAAGGTPISYRAERPTIASAFGSSVAVSGLPLGAQHPFPSADELTLHFIDLNGSQFDLYAARRDDASAPFAVAKKLPLAVAGAHHTTPVLRTDEQELLFSAVAVGTTNFNIWRAFPFDGGYLDSGPLNEINSNLSDHDPALSADGLDIYFGSERVGPKSKVWVAHRDTLPEKFRTATVIAELTPDAGYVSPSSISPDNCRLYFHSDQDPSASADIYVAERAR
jgi:hypothetical protein